MPRSRRAPLCAALLLLALPAAASAAREPSSSEPWQRISVTDATVTQQTGSASQLVFTLTRPDGAEPAKVGYATADGTAAAPGRYTAASGTVTMTGTTATIAVPVPAGGTTSTPDAAMTLTLSDPEGAGLRLTRRTATGWIVAGATGAGRIDADEYCDGGLYDIVVVEGWRYVRCLGEAGMPLTTAGDVRVDPSAGYAFVPVSKARLGNTTYVGYATQDGTAAAGEDYTATSGRLTMRPDQTTRRIAIPIAPGGAGTFTVHFSDPMDARLDVDDVTVTIVDPHPLLTGAAGIGLPLTAWPGESVDDPVAVERVWQRCDAAAAVCTDVPGAHAGQYAVTAADAGFRLRALVSPIGADGSNPQYATNASAVVEGAPGGGPGGGSDDPDGDGRGPAVAALAPAPPGPPLTAPAPLRTYVTALQRRTRASLLAGRVHVGVWCTTACALRANVTIPRAAAKQLRLRTATIGAATANGTGRVLLGLRLTPAARRALRAHRGAVVATVAGPNVPAVRLAVR